MINIEGWFCVSHLRFIAHSKTRGARLFEHARLYEQIQYNFEHLRDGSICTSDVEWVGPKVCFKATRATYVPTFYHPASDNVTYFLDLLEQKIIDLYTAEICNILVSGDINLKSETHQKPTRQTI